MDKYNNGTPPKDKKQDQQSLANDLMTVMLREGQAIGELKEHKQRVMELETQVKAWLSFYH